MPASFSTVNHKSFLSIRGVRTRGPRVRSDSFEMNKKKEGGGFIKIIDLALFLRKKIDSREG